MLDADAPLPPMAVYEAGVPVLGICYGEQAMAHQLGGRVEGEHDREFGRAFVEIGKPSALFDGVWQAGERHQVWMSHGDRVTALPPGFAVIGTSENAPFAMIADEKRRFYATQFHLEVAHTPGRSKAPRPTSSTTSPASPATGRWPPSATRRSSASARRSARAG